MQVIGISTPQLLSYYISPDYINEIKQSLKCCNCETDSSKKKIICTIPYKENRLLYEVLKFYHNKTGEITLGNQKKYEKEAEILRNPRDKNFIIDTEYARYHLLLHSIYINKELIVIIFDILE